MSNSRIVPSAAMRALALVTAAACALLGCNAKDRAPAGSRAAMSGSASAAPSVGPQLVIPSAGASASNAGHGSLTRAPVDVAKDEDASTADQCATAEYEAKLRPLDMLVLLDQSGSMTEHDDRWTPTTNAIKSFVSAPQSAGIGIGLQYFPLGKNNDEKCVGTTYAQPAVPVAPLPGNAAAMVQSIDAHYFTKDNCCDAPEHKGTPTRPALEGVFEYLRGWLAQHPERDAVALLATDGEPSSCDSNKIEDVSRVMSEAASATPSLKTYVIGIGDEKDLEKLAMAGGTGHGAFAVDGTGGMTEKQLLETFNKIRGESSRCDFDIPSAADSDPNLTNVETSTASKSHAKLVKVQKQEDCERAKQGGWYQDATTHRIQLCPDVCQSVRMEPGVKVNIVVGCQTVVLL